MLIAPPPPSPATAQSHAFARSVYSLTSSDPAFLDACEALDEAAPEHGGVPARGMFRQDRMRAWRALELSTAFMFGVSVQAGGQQVTTRRSATGVRHLAHCEQLPSAEAMR